MSTKDFFAGKKMIKASILLTLTYQTKNNSNIAAKYFNNKIGILFKLCYPFVLPNF